jgi:hypothetical protein
MEKPLDQDARGLHSPREDLDYSLTSRAGWEMFGFSSSITPFYSFSFRIDCWRQKSRQEGCKSDLSSGRCVEGFESEGYQRRDPHIHPDGKLFGEVQVKPRPRVELLELRVVFHPSRVVHASSQGLRERFLEFLNAQNIEVNYVDPYWLNGKVSEL